MKIAIIPARGGSKRIPRKNIKEFRGKPMIAWSIDAALASGCFDVVLVSTDDEEIAEIARNYGAAVPFLRPPELSDDFTPTIPVLRNAVAEYEKYSGKRVNFGCCIYATAPFVSAEKLKEGIAFLESDGDLDFAFSVTSFPFPIQRALKLGDDGRVSMFQPEHELSRSQDLRESYHDAGQFYWFRPSSLEGRGGFFSARARPVVLPREEAQDIDTPEDWQCAELIHEILERRRS
ncbi:pseudaminic acid cytidylyltransferase [Akkermansiaceae bacterium]|nr:pseudaminic acid cytidylyltransferase [Akkermansiaceae bacterium]